MDPIDPRLGAVIVGGAFIIGAMVIYNVLRFIHRKFRGD
jgi:hypothetical protein